MVYTAPTSAGKTLVSEILMTKVVVERHKKALFILPFISLVREKMHYLKELLLPANLRVAGFYGGYSSQGSYDIAVCTIEKANSIINRLLESNKLDEIGTIVVDEIHLVSDDNRGVLIEILLAKVMFACKKYGLNIQIIAMSATLPNLNILGKWLNAETYSTTFRPVELIEMIKIGEKMYDNVLQPIRSVSNNNSLYPNDQDNVGQLCLETVLDNCSVLIFCPSKDRCEQLAMNLAHLIHCIRKTDTTEGKSLSNLIKIELINPLKQHLVDSPGGLDKELDKVLSYGCAYHHAGLTTEEREIIEQGFKDGLIKILVATSTLSSGVNLPARRVIIRTPLFAGKIMSELTYRQMIGRAGRKGKVRLSFSWPSKIFLIFFLGYIR